MTTTSQPPVAPERPRRGPPAARILPSRVFYGWYIAIGCAAMMMVAGGVGYYGLAVFLDPLQEEHGWSNSAVSGATSMFFLVGGVVGAVLGPYIDRNGPRVYQIVGVLLMGVVVMFIGGITELWQLYAIYATVAVGNGLASAVSINAMMARWWIRRRARAMSISATGVSLGGVILTPLGAWMVERGGLSLAAPALGAAVLVVALPVVLFVLTFDPRDMGLLPDGDETEEDARAAVAATGRQHLSLESQSRMWTRGQAMRTVSFWAIIIGFVLVLMAQTGFVIHQIAFLEERLGSRSAAAFALSTTALGSIIARLAVGSFADNMDKRWLTVGLFVVQATSVLLVIWIENSVATYVLILIFGFTIGNVYMMQSLITAEIFGMVSLGSIFGLVTLAGQAGSGLGPFAVGVLEDATGSYNASFVVTALITYAAAAVIILARPVPPAPSVDASAAREGEDAAG
ncbi:MAG: MFS transporter [Dehalococcoidia bacterium]|nr:MFS transporter [Dehalococcoidia bacterium]